MLASKNAWAPTALARAIQDQQRRFVKPVAETAPCANGGRTRASREAVHADFRAPQPARRRPHRIRADRADHGRLDRARPGRGRSSHRRARRARRTGPSRIPTFYRLDPALLAGPVPEIHVLGEDTSGEVEVVLLALADGLWVGLGSDHTDRAMEAHGVALAKQLCRKPMAAGLWRFDEVIAHWDEMILRAYIIEGGERTLYMESALGAVRPPADLIRALPPSSARAASRRSRWAPSCSGRHWRDRRHPPGAPLRDDARGPGARPHAPPRLRRARPADRSLALIRVCPPPPNYPLARGLCCDLAPIAGEVPQPSRGQGVRPYLTAGARHARPLAQLRRRAPARLRTSYIAFLAAATQL